MKSYIKKRQIVYLFILFLFLNYGYALDSFQLNNKGLDAFHEGDKKKALEFLTTAINQYPEKSILYNNRGVIKFSTGDLYGALDDYNKGIKLSRDDLRPKALCYFNRGKLRVKMNQLRIAIWDFDRCLKIDKKFSAAYKRRGEAFALLAQKDLDSATQSQEEI